MQVSCVHVEMLVLALFDASCNCTYRHSRCCMSVKLFHLLACKADNAQQMCPDCMPMTVVSRHAYV